MGLAGRRVGKLTARGVAAARKPLTGDGGGLYLKVGDYGAKSWVFRHQVMGKVRTYGLGPIHTVDLVQARKRAEAIRTQLLDNIDPREAKRAAAVAAAKSITFSDSCARYIASHESGWSVRHAGQWRMTLSNYCGPIFGALPVSAIDTGLVMRVLQPLWTSKNATAFQLRARIEAVLAWAEVHGYREGANPARWRGNLDHLLPRPGKVRKVEHHAALPYADIPAFMYELRERNGVPSRALEFTILCAVRTNETLNATWSEFDLANKLWTIPPGRMKADREHRIPLCDRALAIVQEMQAASSGAFLFPGARRGRPLSNMGMLLALRRIGASDLTVHGFRSTFRTWAAERTTFQREVIEAALAHVIGDRTENSYQRGTYFEKRRELMDSWASYCASGDTISNVVVAFR